MATSGSASQNRERFIGTEAFKASALVFDPDARREERVDGATSDEFAAYRLRDRHTPDFPYSDLTTLCGLFVIDAVHVEGQRLDAKIDGRKRAGAPRKSKGFEALAHESATSDFRSSRKVDRMLSDKFVWQMIIDATMQAWPDNPERWASPTPINRKRRDHLLNSALAVMDEVVEHKGTYSELAVDVASGVGMADPTTGTSKSPDVSHVILGDATWCLSRFNRTEEERYDVDPSTGEILRERRFDPDTGRKHYNAKKAGQALVSLAIRNPHPHEWIVADFEYLEPGRSNEGEVFLEMAGRIAERLPRVRAVAYDMALSDAQVNEIIRRGLHALVKVPRVIGNRPAAAHIGSLPFAHPKGTSRGRNLVVDAVDGCPVITVNSDGEDWVIPLVRISTKFPRRAKGNTVAYGIWEIPDDDRVPESWVGLRCRVRHDSDPCEPTLRTRALRTIPENDPDWSRLFGTRNSIESMHAHLKEGMPGRRFRNVGQRRRTINHCGYMLSRAVSTLLAHHHRTGADLERWFGQWKPPDPKWWLSEEAA